ncbi:winged helix-turn-helix transcriptional regulator [Streptomyces albus subsp. chlorinus]|uniref:winged helix-turn-helix domain-containing protein n=1 Tax=Streptomyces albus TaxID=1888 RepID=UPI001570FA15|nr:winged helix-turn-helix domain-containing protein [Streptomyces albus]NSC25733.1 winged helix-turn-helix transcriptional regulator [Streptomyces albus subsp. chlorinus]
MGQKGTTRRIPAVNRGTGEIVQLELLGRETFQQEGGERNPVLPGARYDWQPHPGRHVNVAKALMRKVWHKDSGYRQNDRDIFGFFVAHSPERTEPLRMTFKEIAQTLGIRPDTVARSVGRLHAGGLLLEAEKVGRMRFYRINPRAAFDGSASEQLRAVQDARFPVVPAPRTPPTPRKKEAS